MNPLEIFKGLKLADGSPDLNLRRIQLNNLILNLKSSEIFKLQENLENLLQKKEGNDFFEKLPSDVCFRIVDNLFFEDILRLRLVCKLWHQVFCNTNICAHAIKRYFPLPLNFYHRQSISDWTGPEGEKKKGEWLQKFMINRIRRENGIASRTYHLDYNLDLSILEIRYSSGRVAFTQKNGFTVEDLVTKQRYLLEHTPDAVFKGLWQLSDQYLLAVYTIDGRSGCDLVAWDLISKQMHRVRLPGNVHSFSAFQNQVGIVITTSAKLNMMFDSRIWVVGGSLQKLHKVKYDRNSPEKKIVNADVFFHGIDKDVVFLVYYSQMKPVLSHTYSVIKVTVECFEAGILTQTYLEGVYNLTDAKVFRSRLITNDNKIGIEVWELPDLRQRTLYKHLVFDMSKRKFECQKVHLHPDSWQQLTCYHYINLVWRDQVYMPVNSESGDGFQVITVSKSLSDIWYGLSQSASSSSITSNRTSLSCGETRSHSTHTKIVYNYAYFFECGNRVWGDDGYLVVKSGKGLRIWEFDAMGLEPAHHPLKNMS